MDLFLYHAAMVAKHRKLHRLLGLLLAAPLILWMLTGLLFHIKHRYGEAYESLEVPQTKDASWENATLSPAELFSRGAFDTGSKISLQLHPSKRTVYTGLKDGKGAVIDAQNGTKLEAASEEEAKLWVEAAVGNSKNFSRYGSITNRSESNQFSMTTGSENPAFVFEFSGEKKVTVDRLTGEITQTGALNDWIDFTYEIHYLQWTPWQWANITLVLLAVPLALGLAISGLRMFFQK